MLALLAQPSFCTMVDTSGIAMIQSCCADRAINLSDLVAQRRNQILQTCVYARDNHGRSFTRVARVAELGACRSINADKGI